MEVMQFVTILGGTGTCWHFDLCTFAVILGEDGSREDGEDIRLMFKIMKWMGT
jgi:hypothetical protein